MPNSGHLAVLVEGMDQTIKDAMEYKVTDTDNRLSYRQGWPLLPVLPVLTSRDNIPKVLSRFSDHLNTFSGILAKNKVTVHGLEVAHRFNPGTRIGKSTLTLCVLSEENENEKWADAIRALRTYIQGQSSLTLAVEIIDHRVFHGLYTLRILPEETRLISAINRKKHGVVRILDESMLDWTSLQFWWRGNGKTREHCRPTVLVGTPLPQSHGWWGSVKELLAKKMGSEWTIEVCFKEVAKY
jgi:hypothetical protein